VGGILSLQAENSAAAGYATSHPVAISAAPQAVAGDAAPVATAIHAGAAGLTREVFGFALASSLADPTYGYPSWNFTALSTVAFFGLHINWDGTIVNDSGLTVWNSSALTGLLSVAHAHNTKVLVTIILQDFAAGTPNMCAGLINRAVTVAQTAAQVAAKHVDGVNIDYEGLNGTCQNGLTSQAMLTDFARQLRAALPYAYLSIDTYASSAVDTLGFFDVPGLAPYVDSFFVMAYDLEYSNWRRAPAGCTSFCLGPTAPLTGYYYNDTNTAAQYLAVVAASKVILGVPYYGRKACVGGVAANAYPTGTVAADTYTTASSESTDPAVSPGSYTSHRDANDPSGLERWDTWFNTSLGCTRELYWDDVTSLGQKYDLVNKDGLRGVGIWNLNYGGGAPELWAALLTHFDGCASVSVSVNPASKAPVGTKITMTAAAAGCASPNPVYEFWALGPGSSTWQVMQAYSTSPTVTWSSGGLPAGTYQFAVWARDAGSAGAFGDSLGRWDAYAMFSYTLAPAPCTGVTATFSPSAGGIVGTQVTVTATATGCSHPLYEFWLLPPSSAGWLLAQAYSATPTYGWKAWSPAGVYRWSVWARDSTSPGATATPLGSWDAYAAPQYTVGAPCSSVTASVSPSGFATVGSQITVTAVAAGCQSPLYEFWVLPAGSSTWLLGQSYGAGPTYKWTTTGQAAGAIQLSVWARDSLSPGTTTVALGGWDAYKTVPYALAIPCTSATATFAPPATAKSGTAITVTPAATGCPHPLAELWILAPGSSTWQLVQGYTGSTSFVWSTTGKPAGVYHFNVWARDASSPGLSGNALGRWDAYAAGTYTLS
jgi:spore germination protein YaaH